jgi:hypothetical protein
LQTITATLFVQNENMAFDETTKLLTALLSMAISCFCSSVERDLQPTLYEASLSFLNLLANAGKFIVDFLSTGLAAWAAAATAAFCASAP